MRIPDILKLPHPMLTDGGKVSRTQLTCVENVAGVIEQCDVRVRWDVMRQQPEITIEGAVWGFDEGEAAVVDRCAMAGIKVREQVREYILLIAKRDPFHPMEVWLKDVNGEGSIAELAATVETDSTLWETYLRRWMIQVCEAVCGWRNAEDRALPYVLVFTGKQGAGKTRWFGKVGGKWLKPEAELHLSSASTKDHQLAVLRYPMAELSELDGIFRKSDVSLMKSFLSRGEDELRAPYERRAVRKPRMTAFCGSVNVTEFLTDITGARRFWPVAVGKIEMPGAELVAGAWGEAYEAWCDGEQHWLTPAEERAREMAAEGHTAVTPLRELLDDYLTHHEDVATTPMNRTEVLHMLYGRGATISNAMAAEAGIVLAERLGKHKTIGKKQRAWEVPYNATALDRDSWPEPRHLKGV